jgi:LytS/YehU family sensor histidine kinase
MKTELDFLNAQFNPHFLFNSIHSIYGHIDKNNGAARRMLLSFSEMLRYQLYECNTDSIGIDKETAYIRNYVALQQARKEPGLDVKLEISEKVTGFRIAPLLFIAFIENAFKYVGSENEKPQWIHICFNLSDQQLIFRCINSKDDMLRRPIDHKGIGIANTKRRLELLYPGAHTLTINALPATYEIILQLKMS